MTGAPLYGLPDDEDLQDSPESRDISILTAEIKEAIASGDLTMADWLDIGMEQRWIGPIVCTTHDGIPTTAEEDAAFEEDDPCISMIRPYVDADEADAVEANHSPSVWRKPREG